MRIRYCIIKLPKENKTYDEIVKAKLVSTVIIAGYAIIGRNLTNKTTLRKILKKHLGK